MSVVPASSVTSIHLPVRNEWLDQLEEEILEPALQIIDPHHHIWDRPDWRYMIDDLATDLASGHNIIGTVFVQCRSMHRIDGPEEMAPIGETEFVNGVAAIGASGLYGTQRICAGIVGHADLTLGQKVKPVLDAHILAGGGRFRGIRHISAWHEDPELTNPSYPVEEKLLLDSAFRQGFAELEKLNLSFDAWLYHPQISELIDLAQTFPETSIILDHCGGPLGVGKFGINRKETFVEWKTSIRELARCPNVTVKIGGLGMRINGYTFHEGQMPPGSDELSAAWAPYIETCIEYFGSNRCMFESNFPVDKGSYSYPIYWNACKKITSGASIEEKANLYRNTAAKVYKLDLPNYTA
ncbi:MAG: amidohydrolase [Rhodospirillaceae bacterium]|nr:amidohydrolase [Rhodospirillaceae bacterium]|tara:strand:- start:299 stop:1360 length:1062 start_codon:yes stop_codon:yes gene_type:complete